MPIYSLNSYVFEYDYYVRKTAFYITGYKINLMRKISTLLILKVKDRIKELLKEDKYIEAEVYFKPKKMAEDGIMEISGHCIQRI